jgi:hypothetical protein
MYVPPQRRTDVAHESSQQAYLRSYLGSMCLTAWQCSAYKPFSPIVVCSEQHIILLKADRISLVAFKVNIKPLSGSAQLKIIYTILVGEEKLLCVGNDYNLHDDGFHHGNHDQSQVRTTHMVIRASPAEEGNITGGINWVAPPTQATGYSNITFISGSEVSCRRC